MQNNGLGVPLGQRYHAAWLEINARLISRQTVNLYFATVSIGLASTIIGQIIQHPNDQRFLNQHWLDILAVSLVVLTWVFAFWIRHNDAVIGLLSSFCKALEIADDPTNKLGIPAWHTDTQEWIVQARGYRKFSDYATIILAVIATLPALATAFWYLATMECLRGFLFFIFSFCGLSAAVFIYRNANLRKKIAASHFTVVEGGEWKFAEPK